jgi:uncharacterized membrane protein
MTFLRQLFTQRPRLSMTALGGLIAFFCLPNTLFVVTRALISWNIAVWSYLALMAWLMMRADQAEVQKIAQREDEGAVSVLFVLSLAASASLIAIIWELRHQQGFSAQEKVFDDLLTAMTVLGSWLLVVTIFTFHYALLFYLAPKESPPLRFPNKDNQEELPNYWDFLYFSTTIAVAAQTSDVVVTSRAMRKVVMAQSLLSFFFNAAILGFSINIAASVVGN